MNPDEATAPEEFGPYLVYERLGVGGMATVHRAKKRGIAGFERGVALKRMLPHLAEDAEFIHSFVREAKLASMLVHSNIAQIYDFGRVGSVYYIAMEHVDGFDVRKMLRHSHRHKEPLPLGVVLSILTELCDALEYAHTFVDENGQPQGIVHRDVSPSNLIVAQSGHLKVIDFGIAKANVRQLHTEGGRVKGKLGYMSPETMSGRPFGPVSDVFSAGVVAYELLTAHPLFSAKTDYDTIIRIHEAEVPPPSRRNPSVPAALDDLVLAALARDPERRLPAAGAFRQGLEYVAEQVGIRFSARDVAEWRAKIATTEDPWGARISMPSASSSSGPRSPLPESRGSLPAAGPRPRLDTSTGRAIGRTPASAAPRADRGTTPLGPVSEDEKAIADLTWGSEAAPSSLLHPIPDRAAPPLSPPAAPASAAMSIGAALLPRRRRSFAPLALVVLSALAAGLAAYQFVLRPPRRPHPVAPPSVASIRFVVQPADAVVEIGGKEAGNRSPFETRLDPGVYSIRVRKEGYKPWTTEVTLRGGDRPTVQVALEPGTARLSLSSQPPGLAAELDGKQLEQVTPLEIPVPTGPHVVVVTSAAGITWSQSFTAEVDGQYTYVAPLAATRRPGAWTDRSNRTERTLRPAPAPARVASKEPQEPAAEPEPRAPAPRAEVPAPPASRSEAPAPPEPPRSSKLPAPPSPKVAPLVAPTAVTKLSGEIPAMTADAVQADFTDVVAKLCIDEHGAVSSAKIVKALPVIADELRHGLETWRYKPYTSATGQVTPACFPVTFRVVFKRSG